MVSIKLLILTVIVASLIAPDFVEAAKKQRHNIKHKKSNNNGKLKATFKQAPSSNSKPSQRNPKMNYYNSHSWPSANSYYRPASSSSMFLRSPTPTMFYPMHWGSSYYNSPSLMSSGMFRRSDDFLSTPSMAQSAQTPMMSLTNSQTPMMSMTTNSQTPLMNLGNSQTPTIIDMSAFTGSGLMDNPFSTSSSQNLWSMGENVPSSKSKLNFFNGFNFNDDGLFGNLFSQFR